MASEGTAQRISADELEYLTALVIQQKALQAAMQPYEFHLAKKYQLTEGDRIEEDGTIVRVPNAVESIGGGQQGGGGVINKR